MAEVLAAFFEFIVELVRFDRDEFKVSAQWHSLKGLIESARPLATNAV